MRQSFPAILLEDLDLIPMDPIGTIVEIDGIRYRQTGFPTTTEPSAIRNTLWVPFAPHEDGINRFVKRMVGNWADLLPEVIRHSPQSIKPQITQSIDPIRSLKLNHPTWETMVRAAAPIWIQSLSRHYPDPIVVQTAKWLFRRINGFIDGTGKARLITTTDRYYHQPHNPMIPVVTCCVQSLNDHLSSAFIYWIESLEFLDSVDREAELMVVISQLLGIWTPYTIGYEDA